MIKLQSQEVVIKENLQNQNWSIIHEIIHSETNAVLANLQNTSSYKDEVDATLKAIDIITEIIRTARVELEKTIKNKEILKLTTECFRFVRNLSATAQTIQTHIIEHSELLNETERLLCLFFDALNDNNLDCVESCLLILMQFLANSIVQNATALKITWVRFKTYVVKCLSSKNMKIANVSYSIVYSVLQSELKSPIKNPMEVLLPLTRDSFNYEYPLLVIEQFITHSDTLLIPIYKHLPLNVRLLILDVTKDMLDEQVIPEYWYAFIAQEFKMKSDRILKTISSYVETLEPEEVVSLLNIISSETGNETHRFRKDKSMFINCAYLLQSMHSLGKESSNAFTSISRLSELSPGPLDPEIEDHVAFGFKAQLIRTIGNLLYGNAENKKLIRELDCIPVLLDCCNIDARNPLIMQWAIFAIRNLCEDCSQNKAIIESLSAQSHPRLNKTIKEEVFGG